MQQGGDFQIQVLNRLLQLYCLEWVEDGRIEILEVKLEAQRIDEDVG